MSPTSKTPTPTTLGTAASFGFGDRIGLATPGHVRAMQQAGQGILPIFPQQSIREMTRTSREPGQVMSDAMTASAQSGWTGPIGADADHLKTPEDVARTVAAGFTLFTIDPSDHVDEKSDSYNESTLRQKFDQVEDEVTWYESYLGKTVTLPNNTQVLLDEEACMRCAVKYGKAISEALNLAQVIGQANQKMNRDYEIELSVDETDQPTTLAEHIIIADQCVSQGMKLVSLAPRFIGDMEKGIDYIGDVHALENSLNDHAAVAQHFGGYKLSLHSGSDKLSMYPALARATKGRFHVKTAGTSYLEALRVAAIHETTLFRRIVDFARKRYDTDKATYHVHATLQNTPDPQSLTNAELEREYLELWSEVPQGKGFTKPGRQILHCTFGSTLTDPTLGKELRDVLESHPQTYADVLRDHFTRHLQALQAGM